MLERLLAVTGVNLRGLPARWGSALVIVVCLAGVTGVLVSMLAMARGLEQTFSRAGREDRVIVLSAGEVADSASSITRAQAPLLLSLPGIARRSNGSTKAELERYTLAQLPNARTRSDDNLILRGVGAAILEVRPETRIVKGRMFAPGLRELVIGRATEGQFEGLVLGREVQLSGTVWQVVGVFTDGGSAHESEAWADVEAVMMAYNQDSYSAMTAMLESRQSLQVFREAVTTNPQLSHTVASEPEYYASQTSTLSAAMRVLGYVVAAIMALGAVFAAVNTMFSVVEARTVEIATLRALGFGAFPIVGSILIECVSLCVAGALIGSTVSWIAFNGYTASTMNGLSQSRVAFSFSVGGDLMFQAVALACATGILGGLWPAIRAARMPIIEALREM